MLALLEHRGKGPLEGVVDPRLLTPGIGPDASPAARAFADLRTIAETARLDQAGPAGGLFADELFTQDAGHARVYLPVKDSPALEDMDASWELPGGRFAVALHSGRHRDVDRTYAALGSYAATHDRDGAVRCGSGTSPIRSTTRTTPSGRPRSAGLWLR